MAKRFAIFVLLGPLLVWLILLIGQLPLLIRRPSLEPWPFYFLVLGILMIIGFLPAFALACADHVMAWKRLPRRSRAVICAVIAYPVTMAGATPRVGRRSFGGLAVLPIRIASLS